MTEEDTPIVECRHIVGEDEASGVAIPVNNRREEGGDMSQSYHEIFDTQGYHGKQERSVR